MNGTCLRVRILWVVLPLMMMSGCGSSGSSTDSGSGSRSQMGGAIQGTPLALTGAVSTLAGWTSGGAQDGTGATARFCGPSGVAQDGTNLFVADTYANTIRKVVIATGAVTTVAGIPGTAGATDCTVGSGATFDSPVGIATDGTSLYVADTGNSTIRRMVIATGAVTTVAGIPGTTGATDCTVGSGATFNSPAGVATDGTNLYVTDSGNATIRRIVIATGSVTTVAGIPGNTGATDCTVGSGATFNSPAGIATDGTNLYVADMGNSTIRRIVLATGAVTTIAGSAGNPGSADGAGASAGFREPLAIATDGVDLYVADSGNGTIRRVVAATGVVSTIAGTATGPAGSDDGTGPSASFYWPCGITADATSLYVTDTINNNLRRIAIATGVVTTMAGIAIDQSGRDGTGMAATFFDPASLATDGTSLYVADIQNNTIRKAVIATGEVTTIAGAAETSGSTDGIGSLARFSYPFGITTDGTSLYVADTYNSTIRKIAIATGTVTTLAGTPGVTGAMDCTVGSGATFNFPYGITTDGTSLYVADTGNNTIRKIAIATGTVTTLAGTAGITGATDCTVGPGAAFDFPYGVTTDGTSVYVADTGNHTIRRVALATGAVTTLAGSAGIPGADDGVGAAARFRRLLGMTTDGTSLYVADPENRAVRKIAIATREVTTIAAGTPSWPVGDVLSSPAGITTDGTSLFVGDTGVQSVRKID